MIKIKLSLQYSFKSNAGFDTEIVLVHLGYW